MFTLLVSPSMKYIKMPLQSFAITAHFEPLSRSLPVTSSVH
jgi:hypothetical protein